MANEQHDQMEIAAGMTCPRCGRGTLSPQVVDETIAVGANALQVRVPADVCSFCDEHWFGPSATATIDRAIARLRDSEMTDLTLIGEVYRAS
jgi:YgiT-type zinc finger domain-containing protein